MRLTTALAALAAAGTVLFASSMVESANAMGPAGPAVAKKADISLVESVRYRRYYRLYYPGYYYRPRPYYYSYAPAYYYRPYYAPYYYGAYSPYPYYPPYYGPRFYGGAVGVWGPGFGVRVGW